jgi:phosphohistidine swiveling domain-containing protein
MSLDRVVSPWGTKADVLERLRPQVRRSRILPQFVFTVAGWRQRPAEILGAVARSFAPGPVIVRSSARNEDGWLRSEAGRYTSVADVDPRAAAALRRAIARVIDSYDTDDGAHQVLVQPMLTDLALSGVVLTRDVDTLAPYYVFNFDAATGRAGAVTSGTGRELRGRVHLRAAPAGIADARIAAVHAASQELEDLSGCDRLDIEFAVTSGDDVVTFQVRPLAAGDPDGGGLDGRVRAALAGVRRRVEDAQCERPPLLGRGTLYGVMPDWNPAEMLGLRPRRLAVSLYQTLITDVVWAEQRRRYGYRDVRGFPLLVELAGIPFVDVRVDFNSFVPADLDGQRAARLVDFYLEKLRANPESHDKVEFDVVFSCHTPDLAERAAELERHGFGADDRGAICASLTRLTRRMIHPERGLHLADQRRFHRLPALQAAVLQSGLPPRHKIRRLLEDCRSWGTLPFAGLARAAFVAIEWLRALERLGVTSRPQRDELLATCDTVTARLQRDVSRLWHDDLSRADFLDRYGHLRPGTYHILSKRYDEAFDAYFSDDGGRAPAASGTPRKGLDEILTAAERREIDALLRRDRLGLDAAGFLRFVSHAVQGRELAKFHFSRSVSDALRLLAEAGRRVGLSEDDLSHLDVRSVLDGRPEAEWRAEIDRNREAYRVTERIKLPVLIRSPEEVFSFELSPGAPTFVTAKNVVARTVPGDRLTTEGCRDRIALLESADPGYDWIFARRIAGLITLFGGPNSHMAIRAAELGIPAVIGCGEQRWRDWSRARVLEIDAGTETVNVVR